MPPTPDHRPPPTPFRSLNAAGRFGLLALAILGLMVPQASAGRRRPDPKTPEYKESYDEIESVNTGAHTVTIATMKKEVAYDNERAPEHERDHKTKANAKNDAAHATSRVTLTVNDLTEIEVNGRKSGLSGLRKGMKVDVTKGLDDTTAARLVVQ